jgi:hypothetical protein
MKEVQELPDLREFSAVGLDCSGVSNQKLGDFFQKRICICSRRISQILSQDQIVSALFERALRDVEKPCFVAHAALPESFCNVGRNRNRSAPNLIGKAINLTSGKACRERINCEDKPMRLLPYHQVLECLCWFCHVEKMAEYNNKSIKCFIYVHWDYQERSQDSQELQHKRTSTLLITGSSGSPLFASRNSCNPISK